MFLNYRFSICVFSLFKLGFTDVGSGVTVWIFFEFEKHSKTCIWPFQHLDNDRSKIFLNGKIIITVLKHVMFFVWDGFRILFRPFGPSREAGRCNLSLSELFFLFFNFLLFPFFAFEKGFCFWRRFWENTQPQKKGSCRAKKSTLFPGSCLFLPRFSREKGGWCCFLLLPYSSPPSFLLQGCGAWVVLHGLFLLLVVMLSRSPYFREGAAFPILFWCGAAWASWVVPPSFWLPLFEWCCFNGLNSQCFFFSLSIFPWQVFWCFSIFEKASVARP